MIKKLSLIISSLLLVILFPLIVRSAAEAKANTQLLEALRWDGVNEAQSALNNKANVNASFEHGFSPLHLAARCNEIDAVNMLIAHNANINAHDENNATPLILAVKECSYDVIRSLILADADLYVQDTDGKFAINYVDSPRALIFFLAAIEDRAIIRKEQQLRDAIEIERQEVLAAMDAVQEQKEAAIKAIQALLK